MEEFNIDRLVLEIPGISASQAEELSHHIGQELAEASSAMGSFDNITIDLHGQQNTRDMPALAKTIVASMLQQIG